ncbi:MAG: DUF3570 domain-containing protein [Halobacteria archaeon]|nr:DUF3570 domain-containing protein [Halobacteria archaeon]
MDFVERAREYAINAHKRIDHRRKYTQHPYSVHLAAVAKLIASASDDPEIIAAALRLRYFLPYRAAVYSGFRYFSDDWDIDANTFDVVYLQPFRED